MTTGAATPAVEVDEHGEVNELIAAAMTAYQQADVLESLTTVPAVGPGGEPVLVPAPLGVVLVSQTCDIVLPGRQAVQVARRIRLTGNQAREARDRKRPRFAQLPRISDNDFADLDVIGTVAKSRVAGRPRLAGVATDEEIRRFAGDVARKFGRFAFPDEVTPWLRPLEAVAASKARKPASPEGQAFGEVVELRVEAPAGWAKRPFDLTLCVVVQPNTLPTFAGDAFPDVPDRLNDWLYDAGGELTRSSGEIAGRLLAAGSNAERHWLWMALGEAWAARCRPPVDASPSSMR